MEKFETKTPPNMIEFRHTSLADEWVMRITADRRIEVNEGVEVNDAAKKVLEAMQHMLTPQQSTNIRKPLPWEQVLEIGIECANDCSRLPYEVKIARAIEAAHGIKE